MRGTGPGMRSVSTLVLLLTVTVSSAAGQQVQGRLYDAENGAPVGLAGVFRLDPLRVSVRNEELEEYLTREIGENPNGVFGYRVIQGLALEEVKAGAEDNTEVLRRLFIPVHHGRQVCVRWGGFAPRPSPTALGGTSDPNGTPASEREPDTNFPCGRLYVNGYECPAELLERLDPDHIAVVVTLGGNVHLYRRDFEWTFRPAPGTGAC